MLKRVFWSRKVEEALLLKVGTDVHPVVQSESAIQRSLEKEKEVKFIGVMSYAIG